MVKFILSRSDENYNVMMVPASRSDGVLRIAVIIVAIIRAVIVAVIKFDVLQPDVQSTENKHIE